MKHIEWINGEWVHRPWWKRWITHILITLQFWTDHPYLIASRFVVDSRGRPLKFVGYCWRRIPIDQPKPVTKEQDMPMHDRQIYAKLNRQQTACAETAVCSTCFSNNHLPDPNHKYAGDPPATLHYVDCSDNEALSCQVCGWSTSCPAAIEDGPYGPALEGEDDPEATENMVIQEITVLDDGETWGGFEGATYRRVGSMRDEEIGDANEFPVVYETLDLKDLKDQRDAAIAAIQHIVNDPRQYDAEVDETERTISEPQYQELERVLRMVRREE